MATQYSLTGKDEMTIEECIECGVKFAMPTTLHTWKKDNKKSFYCPNGHAMSYTKNEADSLREAIAQKDRELAELRSKEAQRVAEEKRKIEEKKRKREAAKKK